MSEIAEREEDWLRERVEEIHRLTRLTAAAVTSIGRVLLEVQRRLGGGRFNRWVKDQFRWGRSSAYRMMAVATAFADVPDDTLARFAPVALYALAKPSTPPAVRTAALAAVAAGKPFGPRDARTLIDAAKPDRQGTKFVPCQRDRLPRGEGIRPEDRPQPEDTTAQLLAAKALVLLTEAGKTVRVGKLVDSEYRNEPLATQYTCHLYAPGREPEIVVATDGVWSALSLAAGIQPVRECRQCQQRFPVFEGFSRRSGVTSEYGRESTCKRCLTERVGLYKKRMRGTLPRSKESDAAKREAVRAILTERPTVSNPVVMNEVGCCESFARQVRAELEATGEVPRATTRTGTNGVTKHVLPLADHEVIPLDDLALEPGTMPAPPETCEAA